MELNRIGYGGPISNAEMIALAEYQLSHPDWLAYDVFNLIAADADFAPVSPSDLDAIVVKYKSLFEPRDLVIFRRSAWVSHSPASQAQLDHWIARRNAREAQTLQARQFEDFAGATVWLGLASSAASALETGDGFAEMARFELA